MRHFEREVHECMRYYGVSEARGFLAEDPASAVVARHDEHRINVCSIVATLPRYIKAGRVRAAVHSISTPRRDFSELTMAQAHMVMLRYAFLMHAYLREQHSYRNISELMADESIKYLPPQLAVPMWRLSQITGIAPSLSYGLYSLWNFYRKDRGQPFGLDNNGLIYSFTGAHDEEWFVGIHQEIEYYFARAIPAYLNVYFRARFIPCDSGFVNAMFDCLLYAAEVSEEIVKILRRMTERCDEETYFGNVRLFYSVPKSLVFSGVEELGGQPQQIFGETGAQTPLQHFRLAVLGIYPQDEFFHSMRKHMSYPFRKLIESLLDSRVRIFVEQAGSRWLTKAYNRNLEAIILWREAHMELVGRYITRFGEGHGTGKSPLSWLQERIDEVKAQILRT